MKPSGASAQQTLHLTPTEWQLLQALVRHPDGW